jgi:hypothetical protein
MRHLGGAIAFFYCPNVGRLPLNKIEGFRLETLSSIVAVAFELQGIAISCEAAASFAISLVVQSVAVFLTS